MSEPSEAHKQEMLEGVVDAVFSGDEEAFSVFHDEFVKAQEEHPEPGKYKVCFGGGVGSTAHHYRTEMICPDCGKLLVAEGVRFDPPADAPEEIKALMAVDDEDRLLLDEHHRDMFSRSQPCPAWKWRARVYHAFTDNRVWRKFFHLGMSFAWQKLDYNHPIQGRIYRAIKWKEYLGWRIVWRLEKMVGFFEQRAWERR